MKKLFLLPFLIGLLLVSCQTDSIEETSLDQPAILNKNSNGVQSYMIIAKNETSSKKFESSIAKFGKITNTIPEIGVVVVESSDPNFDKKVMKLTDVRSVVPDFKVSWLEPMDFDPMANPKSIGDDEWFFDDLWGMDAIDAPEAWNTQNTGTGVRVAVLDGGIDAEHPDLAPNLNIELSKSFAFNPFTGELEDWNVRDDGVYFNHGTHVSGTIAAADNQFGVIGVAPNAEIMAVKVLSEYTGSGNFSWINAGIVYAADNGADVINMSLGAVLNKNGTLEVEDGDGNLVEIKIPAKFIQELIHAQQRAIDYAFRKGVTIVVAAGNDYMNADGNASTIVLPADLNNVITVSATGPIGRNSNPETNLDLPASYTNIGRSLIDIAAPGGDFQLFGVDPFWYEDMVLSTIPGGWSWSAGTSMAAPHVAGVAALIIGKNGGEMDPHEVAKQLAKSSDKIDTNGKSLYFGKGRVNAYRAVTE